MNKESREWSDIVNIRETMDIFHGGDIMKVGEARGIYSSVLKSYNQQKFKLSKQRNELKERMESTPDGKTLYADEAATLDLQYNAVAEKQDEYQDYVDQLMEQWESKFNSVAAKQQDRRSCRWNRLWRQRPERWSRNKSKYSIDLVT